MGSLSTLELVKLGLMCLVVVPSIYLFVRRPRAQLAALVLVAADATEHGARRDAGRAVRGRAEPRSALQG